MKDNGIVRGSKAQAVPLIIGSTTVYVHEDIHEVTVEDELIGTHIEWEYHEYLYTLDEYILYSIKKLTPYTETKAAYIGDTEVTFYDVPDGNVTIFFDKPYNMEKVADRITVSFEELEEVTEITISVL